MANEGEDDQPGSNPSSEGGSSSQAVSGLPLFSCGNQFRSFCQSLQLPVDVEGKAEGVLEMLMSELDQTEEVQMTQTEIFVCAQYMALIDARMPYGPHDPQLKQGHLAAPPVTITQLLTKAQLSVKRLLQVMRQVKGMLLLSEAVSQHLLTLEHNFCVMSALAHTFHNRLCTGVFRDEDKPDSNDENMIPSLPETEGVAFRKKLCWLLFIHAKHRMMGESVQLVHGFLALLCCLEYVMRTTPSFLLNSPYDVIRIGCQHTDSIKMPMLAKLCEQFEVSQTETIELYQNFMEPVFQELLNSDGELEMERLEESYLRQHRNEGDLNELCFLSKDALVSPSTAYSNNNSISSSSSSCVQQPPMTPVRATLKSIQQLKNTLSSATDAPSAKLKDYFQICSNDPEAAIAERVGRLRELFVHQFEAVTSPYQAVAASRFQLGVKLYYHMLEQLLNTESQRLSVSVLDTLLNKEDFHTSLLACSLEVVLVAYGLTKSFALSEDDSEQSSFTFPWILDTLQIQSYDFSKVLESFFRAEPRLPVDIVKHLQSVEYKILEHLAWKENSSVFDVIRVCDRNVSGSSRNSPTDNNVSSSTNGQQMCPSAAQLFLSPAPGGQTSQVPASVPFIPRRSQSLTAFFNKVYRLAYHRLQRLCTLLQINRELLQKIWTCFENCITYKTDILKNRHLDQILMCAVYGVCKVVEKDIRFKTIVQEYKNLPTAHPDVFRCVYLTDGKYDSIINFYNQIFMVNMKSFILQFSATSRQATPTLSPVPQPVSPQPASPSVSVMGRKNFLLSPLKESPFKAPASPSQLTPASRQLYCFGDRPGSAEKLRNINATVSAYKRRSEMGAAGGQREKVRRLIQFDNPSGDDTQISGPDAAKLSDMKKVPVSSTPDGVPSAFSKDKNGHA